MHFLFGLIFNYEATTEQGLSLRAPTTRVARADEAGPLLGDVRAPTQEAAELAAITVFQLKPDRKRPLVQEHGRRVSFT